MKNDVVKMFTIIAKNYLELQESHIILILNNLALFLGYATDKIS